MSQQLQKEEQALLSPPKDHAKDDSIFSTKKNADDDIILPTPSSIIPKLSPEDKEKEKQNNDNDDDEDEDDDVVIIAEQHQCTYDNNVNFNKNNGNDKDKVFSNDVNSNGQQHHHHNRDVSIETTSSQSIDISLLFNNHHLFQTQQQGQQNQQNLNLNHYHQEEEEEATIFDGNDSPDSGSLSLAVSQVDFSLAGDDDDLEGIHMDSDHSNGIKSKNGNKAPVVVVSSSHDLHAMVSVGGQLFRESMLAENEEDEKEENRDHERIINKKTNVVTAVSSNDVTNTSLSDDHYKSVSKEGMTIKRRMMMMIFAVCTIMFGFKSLTRYIDTSAAEKVILSCDADVENKIDIDADIDIDTDELPQSIICGLETGDNCQDTVNNNPQDEETNHSKEKEFDDGKVDFYPIYGECTDNKNHYDNLLPIITSSLNTTTHNVGIVIPFGYACPLALLFMACGLWWSLRLLWITPSSSSSSTNTAHKNDDDDDNTKTEHITPTGASSRRSQGSFLTPPSSFENCMVEPMQYMSPCYGDNSLDVSLYDAMKSDELRSLLRHRKCDTTGSKQKLIRKLVTLKQAEFACLTVHQLRPKLRKRNLSQSGNKEQIIRRLVEAGLSEKN